MCLSESHITLSSILNTDKKKNGMKKNKLPYEQLKSFACRKTCLNSTATNLVKFFQHNLFCVRSNLGAFIEYSCF